MLTFPVYITKLVSALLAAVLLPFSLLTDGIDRLSQSERTDISKINMTGVCAYFRSQGMTSDGESFWFSSKTTLIRTDLSARSVEAENFSAIPKELSETYSIAHIGGLSYYNGYIYAGLEDSKKWNYPIVGVYDCDTLELVDYYIMDSSIITRGMPWVCVDPETGYLYCTDHSKKPEKLLVYDTADDMSFVKAVPLEVSVASIQGAEFFNGILYAATNDDTQAIYKIDPETGCVQKHIDRNLTKGSEGEGMTFVVSGGSVKLYAMDMGPLFINAYVREYPYDIQTEG